MFRDVLEFVEGQRVHQACFSDSVSADQTIFPTSSKGQRGVFKEDFTSDNNVKLIDLDIVRFSLSV